MISPRVRPNHTTPCYHDGVVHVRTDGEAPARACEPRELLGDGGVVTVRAETLISRDADGPFAPLALALESDAALRDAVAATIPGQSLAAWWRLRFGVQAVAAVPLLMTLELDRELMSKEVLGVLGAGRLLTDLVFGAYVAFELTRMRATPATRGMCPSRTPRTWRTASDAPGRASRPPAIARAPRAAPR